MYLKFIAKDLNTQINVFRSVGRLNAIVICIASWDFPILS